MRKRPLDRAWRAVAAGKYRRALRQGWEATHDALPRDDADTVEEVRTIADVITQRADAATAAKAAQLAMYCLSCLRPESGHLSSPTEVARLLKRHGRTRRRD